MSATEIAISAADFARLRNHLHRSDHDEHGAIALAGVHRSRGRDRLLVRELRLLTPDEFPPGRYGYRQFAPLITAELAGRAGNEGYAYIAFHSHPGSDRSTALSADDLAGHRRVYPHLLDLTRGRPVAGVAIGARSAAGEVWFASGVPATLDELRVIGSSLEHIRPVPARADTASDRFDRQARLFGTDGQSILRRMRVAVIGAGGGGSILVEQLAHLGIGAIDVIDFDRVEEHNLSRIVGATARDATRRRKKVDVAARHARWIDSNVDVRAIDGDIRDERVAAHLLEADFLFLATDTATSRLVFNAVVHRYLIPGIQIGAKVELGPCGEVLDIYVAVRPVLPDSGCLFCQGLVDPVRLQQEARTSEEARAQNYLDTPDVVDPSVITLNGIAASHATTAMLFSAVGLLESAPQQLFFVRDGSVRDIAPRKDPDCPFCGRHPESLFARGGAPSELPVRPADPEESHARLVTRLRSFAGSLAGRHSNRSPTSKR